MQEAVRRSRELQINDSVVYYFNAIDRVVALLPPHRPEIMETMVKVGELMYKLFDVGGQRGEQKKYDQVLYEDESMVCFIFIIISFLS